MSLRVRLILALIALCGLSLYFRAGTVPAVFDHGFVNFVETDPWYHSRAIEHLAMNFPWRMPADPYSLYGAQEVPTPPFFDCAIAMAAWIAGLGHPSQHLIDVMAAWYPALLGALIVPVVFLLGRKIFGTAAGLMAAAVVATLPGHFLRTGMVGYTDHHVMESLLSALFFLLLLMAIEKPGGYAIAAGATLGAYLLTFHGGSFFIAVVIGWVLFEQIRSRWPRKEPAPPLRPILWALLTALAIVAPFYRTLWMNYSIAALAGGAALIAAIDAWSRRAKSQLVFFGVLLGPVAIAIAAAAATHPEKFRILTRLIPSFAGTSGGVAELQSLLIRNGALSLWPVWEQFGGAIVLTIAGIIVLGEIALKDPDPRRDLIFFWSLTTLLLTLGQVRMTYYFAIAAALVCGYLADRLWRSPVYFRWAAGVAIAALVFAPNIIQAAQTMPGESPDTDWREALLWLRGHTPEPFGDASYYYARFPSPAPRAAYSVLAWWDYGYWIMGIGHRVPMTNPTQSNAGAAAACLLAQNESEAAAILEQSASRYVIVDARLPMLNSSEATGGKFPALFQWDREVSLDDYFLIARQRDANGVMMPRVLYRPAYFRSLLVRLFVFGGAAVEKPSGAALAYLRDDGKNRELVDLREFPSEELAMAAEPGCRMQGCILVSTNSLKSCVRLEALTRFRPVFASSTEVVQNENRLFRKEVQIYEFK